MRYIVLYMIGLIFGLGISISGMANPSKVLNFFDIAGTWDPSLALVMGGALVVTFIGFRRVLARPAPAMAPDFQVPEKTVLDARLIGGSAVFGVGWGLSGVCPGGALPALGTGRVEIVVVVASIAVGIVMARQLISMFTGGKVAA